MSGEVGEVETGGHVESDRRQPRRDREKLLPLFFIYLHVV